jgi:hypothetical protein
MMSGQGGAAADVFAAAATFGLTGSIALTTVDSDVFVPEMDSMPRFVPSMTFTFALKPGVDSGVDLLKSVLAVVNAVSCVFRKAS